MQAPTAPHHGTALKILRKIPLHWLTLSGMVLAVMGCRVFSWAAFYHGM